jgi:hypothetical protein
LEAELRGPLAAIGSDDEELTSMSMTDAEWEFLQEQKQILSTAGDDTDDSDCVTFVSIPQLERNVSEQYCIGQNQNNIPQKWRIRLRNASRGKPDL